MTEAAPRTYRFGGMELEPVAWELRNLTTLAVVEIGPTAFRLLVYLLEHRERVVPKQELMRAVWPDGTVGDDSLATGLSQARRALGAPGSHPRWIRTKCARGYQFTGEVEVRRTRPRSVRRARIHGTPPGASMHFTGRQHELARLEDLLVRQSSYVSLQASVQGMAGVGKTELAVQLAYKLAT